MNFESSRDKQDRNHLEQELYKLETVNLNFSLKRFAFLHNKLGHTVEA